MDATILNGFDAIISISAASEIWRNMGVTRPLVLWTGHDVNELPVQTLRSDSERDLWDKFVLVSSWQADRFSTTFKIKRERITVLRNAIAPAFERSFRKQLYFFRSGQPPVLFYASTPFRGLDVLISAFPLIRTLIPRCEAQIYSSMAIYQTPFEQDAYRHLYELCRRTEGVHYIGAIGQAALAQAMSKADIFAYPSTFAETSCIALMEAMASGCMILSAKLGALPETAAEFGGLCERPADSTPGQFAELYARFVAEAIHDAYKNPDLTSARLDEQRAFALKNYSWSKRAAEWETMLSDLVRQPAQTIQQVTANCSEYSRQSKVGRNDPCPCGSGNKYKRCCGRT
ncbi:MAG: glycosyltransferase [Xanthobacteraceae bacterium]